MSDDPRERSGCGENGFSAVHEVSGRAQTGRIQHLSVGEGNDLKADKRRFQLPSLMTVVFAFILGCAFHSFVDLVLLFDVLGSAFILSFPVIAVITDPTNREAMKETEILIHGLESPFVSEKPRPCSVKDARC